MKEERLRGEQIIPNEVIDAYRDQGIIEHCSEEMRYRLVAMIVSSVILGVTVLFYAGIIALLYAAVAYM
jgi:hypothetical protein